MRLDKFISNTLPYSRKDCQRLARSGKILVNGQPVNSAAVAIKPEDDIEVAGEAVRAYDDGYWMLHKPDGVICANKDSQHLTVIDILQESDLPIRQIEKVQIAGRLDLDTTGLVLLTTNGQWNHALTSPNRKCVKRYRVTHDTPLEDNAIQALETGLALNNEKQLTKPALVSIINDHQCLLSITEGKYHQVKRMFAAVSNRVTALHREAIGEIELDQTLEPGEFRPLSANEIASIL